MKVTAKIQAPGNDPVDMVWSPDTDALGVMLCVTQLLRHAKAPRGKFDPEYLAITIEL
jgi:hypothetical protein